MFYQLSVLALVAIIFFASGALLTYLIIKKRETRDHRRPDWDRLTQDTDYFAKALSWVFKRQGYHVQQINIQKSYSVEGPREVDFKLQRKDNQYRARCYRLYAPIGSDQILAFQEQLSILNDADGAIIITTGEFTPAGIAQANNGAPLKLYDGTQLKKWVNSL